MIRVALFPQDQTGCGSYRMKLPAAAAEDIEILYPPASKRLLPQVADVAVFQRPYHASIAAAIPGLQRAGVAVVVDLDDDLAAAHPQSSIFKGLHPRSNPEANWQHLKRACQLADLVTVATPGLAEHYGAGHARVLPNYVPESLLNVMAERDGRTVGWGGDPQTHIGDLTVTRGGVAQAIDRTEARFLHIGPDSETVRRDLALTHEPDTTGGLPFGEYHQALAQLDVAIAPLADTRFNRCKSGLKVLEAAALGSLCVASPRPDYLRLSEDGLCVTAQDRARDWRRALMEALSDPEARSDWVDRAKATVRDHHTYEKNGWRWTEAWTEAVELRRGSRLVAA